MSTSELLYLATEILSVLVVTSVLTWYLYYQYCFSYWKKKGVPTKPPVFPAGNITSSILGQESLFVRLQNIYREFKEAGCKHAGLYFFNGPIYFPISPEIIKNIMTTDFDHFVDRGTYIHEEKHPLSGHIFSLTGNRWRTLRTKLSPTFTSGKLKTMYESVFMKNTENLINNLSPIAKRGEVVNMKKTLNGFTADIISSSAFGLDSNVLNNPNSKFAGIVGKIFHPPLWLYIKCILEEGFQNPGNMLKAMHANKEVEDFFTKLVKDTTKYREETGIIRNDFMSLLLDIKKKVGLSNNDMVAQSFVFFLAGFETSASTISFCLHELAHNQHLQDKLREELHDNLGKNYTKYTYDDLLKLPYLDKVVKETLRLYPVVGFLNRICVKAYKVPGTDVVIDEGTPVLISTLGLQRDPDYFPDPMRFDPDRFNEKDAQVPFTYMPFGEGPRICIGMRYGQLQTKLGVAALISQYKFLPSTKTPKLIDFDKFSTTLAMAKREGMFLKVESL